MLVRVFGPPGPVFFCFYMCSCLLGLVAGVFAGFRASKACFLMSFRVFGSPWRVSLCFCLFSCLRGLAGAFFLRACGICVFVHTEFVHYWVYVFGCTEVVCLCVWSLGVCVYGTCVFVCTGCRNMFVCTGLGDCQKQPLACYSYSAASRPQH